MIRPTRPTTSTLIAALVLSLPLAAPSAFAADAPPAPAAPAAAPASTARVTLPQAQEYQRVLRTYMATLTEKDFDTGVTEKIGVPPVNPDKEYQYRQFILATQQGPHVGGKRGIPAVNAPSLNFLLTTIEGPKAVIMPPVWVEALGTFIAWDSPGNVYRDNKALKMRAFVTATVKLMMIDNHLDVNAASGITRADWNGYNVIMASSAYPVFKGVLPAEVQKAYETGLLRLARKVLAKGPVGAEPDSEMSAAVGAWYVANATKDAEFAKEAEAYAKKLCTDPRYFHPAGFWVEAGGLDVGFGGMGNFWATWLALASDWPFAKEAVAKAYRLKSHLTFPEPDGSVTGPAAFNSRLGSPASEDQWDWEGTRERAALMITDEAAPMVKLPGDDELSKSVERRTAMFHDHLYGGLRNAPYMKEGTRQDRYLENDEIRGSTWRWSVFPNGQNYPVEVSPGYEFYRKGAYAHLAKLKAENSPLLKSPYLREGDFTRNLGDAFISVKHKSFAALVHVGPVSDPAPTDLMAFYAGPLGFGGGQLSAFWTPEAGSALLGRRGGFAMHGATPVFHDKIDEWRTWPLHAVSGATADGKFFTSGRIAKPQVSIETAPDATVAKVSGVIPQTFISQPGGLTGTLQYARSFRIDDKGVRVETAVTGDGKDSIAELYETLPVYHRDAKAQPGVGSAVIEFQSGGSWSAGTESWSEKVQAVRITRFKGSVVVTFETPRRVKLSPKDWADNFLSRATCRNVLIDLLENGDKATTLKGEKKVAYRVEATGR